MPEIWQLLLLLEEGEGSSLTQSALQSYKVFGGLILDSLHTLFARRLEYSSKDYTLCRRSFAVLRSAICKLCILDLA